MGGDDFKNATQGGGGPFHDSVQSALK